MSYTKVLVDNPTCARRFHLTFDDEAGHLPRVEIRCPHCQVVVFAAEDHAAVKLVREENLTKTSALSDHLVTDCQFEDRLSRQTIPEYKDRDVHVYPQSSNSKRP